MGVEGKLWQAISEGLRSGRPIPLSQPGYREWASVPRITAANSPNHGATGADADATNLANRKPTILDRAAQRDKAQHWAHATLMGNEAFARSIYARWDLDGYRVLRELWREMGESTLADELHAALRGALACLAFGSRRVAQRFFSNAELLKDSPGVYVAEVVPPPKFRNLLAGSSCGARSLNDKLSGTTGRPPKPGEKGKPTPLRNQNPPEPTVIFTEAVKGQLDKTIGDALRKRGRDGRWVPPAESAVLAGVIDLDAGALKTAWGWASACRLMDSFQFFIFRDASAIVCLDSHESSTAPADGCRLEASTGRTWLQAANAPGRDAAGGNDSVFPTRNIVKLENGVWTAHAVRIAKNGSQMPPVVPLVLGRDKDLLFHAEIGTVGATLYRAPFPK